MTATTNVPGSAPVLAPDVQLVELNGLKMYVDGNDTVVGRALIEQGTWEPAESLLFANSVRPGMVVADVGAHIGYYTLMAARRVGHKGRVLAFEPNPRNAEILRRNVELNDLSSRVSVRQVALSDRRGSRRLFCDAKNQGNHSLAEINVAAGAPSIEVDTITLAQAMEDEGAASIDILKIDVQGAEGLVFAGAGPYLMSRRLRAFLEFWPTGLERMGVDPLTFLARLRDGGLTVSTIDPVDGRLDPVVDVVKFLAEFRDPLDQMNLLLERSR